MLSQSWQTALQSAQENLLLEQLRATDLEERLERLESQNEEMQRRLAVAVGTLPKSFARDYNTQ
jgi:hypothetical protein